jgi:hypothetical protein
MREITTKIDIDAPAEKVWDVLMDFEQHPAWNPFVRKIEGEKKLGGRLTVLLGPSGGREMRFTPTVVEFEPNRKFAWLGKLFFSGLFDGRHEFAINEKANGGVEFVHGERFSGILVPLMWGMIEKDTRRGFEEMNAALKARAESN